MQVAVVFDLDGSCQGGGTVKELDALGGCLAACVVTIGQQNAGGGEPDSLDVGQGAKQGNGAEDDGLEKLYYRPEVFDCAV